MLNEKNNRSQLFFWLKNSISSWLKRGFKGWIFVFCGLIIILSFSGISPIKRLIGSIMALNQDSEVINLYATNCTSDTDQNSFTSGWWNLEQAKGAPSVSPDGKVIEFSPGNSAFYQGGEYNIICSGFWPLDDEIELPAETVKASEEPNLNSGAIDELPVYNEVIYTTDEEGNSVKINDEEPASEKDDNALIITDTADDLASSAIEVINDFKILPEENLEVETEEIDTDENINDEMIEVMEEADIEAGNEIIEEETENPMAPADEAVTNEKVSWWSGVKDIFKSLEAKAQEIIKKKIDKLDELGDFEEAKIMISLGLNMAAGNADAESAANNGTGAENDISTSSTMSVSGTEATTSPETGGTTKNEANNAIDEAGAPTTQADGAGAGEAEKDNTVKIETLETNENDSAVEIIKEPAPEEIIIEEDKAEVISYLKKLLKTKEAQAQAGKISDAKLIFWYTTDPMPAASGTEPAADDRLWQQLDTIYEEKISNYINNGYFSFEAPLLSSWEDINNLAVKISGLIDGQSLFTAYIDSVWIEAKFTPNVEREKIVKRMDWENALEMLSEKTIFKINEDGGMRFRYNKSEEHIWDTLKEIVGLGNFWQTVDISAELVDARGMTVDLPLTLVFEEDGEFMIQFEGDRRELTPGKYKIKFHIEDRSGEKVEVFDIEKTIEWGVLAMNFNKSEYEAGNTGYIQMAVLDELGHTVCDAGLTMKVTTPTQETVYLNMYDNKGLSADLPALSSFIYRSPYCGPETVTDRPDYFVYYEFDEAGEYKIELNAETPAGAKSIEETISVADKRPITVERSGPTRIYPKADYDMKITIISEENFNGDIVELVPSGFKIINYEIRITNSEDRDPFGAEYRYIENIYDIEKELRWQDIEILAGDEITITYTFDAPNESPELFLLGPLEIKFKNRKSKIENRQWQVASDAVIKRARTVMFFAGAHNEEAGAGNDSNIEQKFPQFNFRLAETGVAIRSAFVLFEAQFEAYADNAGNYTYTLAFDACAETCTAYAYSGTNIIKKDTAEVVAYDEDQSDQVRLLLDVTNESELAAYTGAGSEMEAQVGYNFIRSGQTDSIGSAKAVLVLTYTYDIDTADYTNTVVYPLESTDTAPDPDDSGTRQSAVNGDCAYGSCTTFGYNMEIPDFPGIATSVNRLSQWYKMHELIDNVGTRDVNTDVSLDGGTNISDTFHHESNRGGTQSAQAAMYFGNLAGFEENTGQTLEYRSLTGAGDNHFLIGGEVFETYMASSSAATKTRTVSYTLGALDNGLSSALNSKSTYIYFPENGAATGTVSIKKAWFRIKSGNAISGGQTLQVSSRTGGNATTSAHTYNYNPGGNIPKPMYDIFHVIPASGYAELEEANIINGVYVGLTTQHNNTVSSVTSAELMITYTYTSEAQGYLNSLQLYGGQMNGVSTTGATSSLANSVAPESGNKTMYSGGILAHYLVSESDSSMGASATFDLDTNIGVSTPSCTRSRVGMNDNNNNGNVFFDYYEDVTSGLTTTDDQSYEVCFKSDETLSPNDGANMGGVLTYTYGVENSAPTSTIESAIQKGDGSGAVEITIKVFDVNGQDLKARLEYEAGTACTFGSPLDPWLDESNENISADYNDPNIENDYSYQIGTADAYIELSGGTNQVYFDWLSKTDIDDVEGDYCLQLTANDLSLDQGVPATSTVYIDNKKPSPPGALDLNSRTGTSLTLNYGATSTETNFYEYKIFYKQTDGTDPTEADSVWASSSDDDLSDKFFNNTATTTINTGLVASTTYSFAIWAYDQYGNRASSSYIDFATNDAASSTIVSASQKNDGSGQVEISFIVDDDNNQDSVKAKLEYVAGAACDFSAPLDPTLDPTSISASFGLPSINDTAEYQIGQPGGYIITSPGQNTIGFNWLGQTDEAAADGIYCLRLTANDYFDDQLVPATSTLTLDNVDPVSTGNLAIGAVTTDSVVIIYATNTPATDTNEPSSNAYKIYYKQGVSGVSTGNTEHDNTDFDAYDYGGTATSTTVSGLNSNTWYVFNIWSYDQFGNRATSTEIAAKTNATLSNDSLTLTNPLTKGPDNNIVLAGTSTEWNFRVVVSETNGWYAISSTTLRLADNADNSAPYNDLVFRWHQTGESFSEVGSDALNAVTLSSNSTSTCAVNTCTLDFKITLNKTFTSPSVDYSAEVYSDNDSGTIDRDMYADIYQVRFPYVEQIHYRWRNDDGGE